MLILKKAVILAIIIWFISPSLAVAEDVVRAKIGITIIKDGNRGSGRKAGAINNILSSKDSFLVHVTPEADAYVYVVNSNANGAELLNANPMEQSVKKEATRIYPSVNQLYKLDGAHEEFITIITAAREQAKIENLFISGPVSHKKWQQVEDDLLNKKPGFSPTESNEITAFGGTVRGIGGNTRTSSGIDLIVRSFKFTLKR